jgi:LysM repeat protein
LSVNKNPWKIRAALVTLVALLALSAIVPAIGHYNNNKAFHLSASASTDPIATGNWLQDQYDPIILQLSQSRNLDPFIVKGVIAIESQFDTYAVSTVINSACGYTHDLGLMQVNPYCANVGSANLFDPWTNINYGTEGLQSSFDALGNINLALQAYNIGVIQVQNGARNWAYSNQVPAYAQHFRNEHAALYGSSTPVPNPSPPPAAQSAPQPSQAPPAQPTSSAASRTYTVHSGDYLYLIGQEYRLSWQAMAAANGINYPYLIYPGQTLKLPSGSTWSYTVQSGDTLYQIGQRYGVSWGQIAQQNGIASPYLIYPGQTLRI